MSITLDGSLVITTPTYGGSITAEYSVPVTSMKNRIINGAMMIDQRNAGASVTPTSGQYVVDRWKGTSTQASKYSMQQNAGSVTPPAGFTNYLGITSLSAYSIVSGDSFSVNQPIEGFNVADLGWGTANAQTVTLSFWVRSSLTGTFGGALRNSAQNRSYPFSFTVSSANTWEQKTVSIAGDTTGTWLTTNGVGIEISFGLGVGATFSSTSGVWSAGNFTSATGATSVVGTNGATFYITGVQLEKGSTATSFDYRPYGTELALCQRYYYRVTASGQNGNYTYFGDGKAYGTSTLNIFVPFPVTMRTFPSSLDTSAMSTYQMEIGNTATTTPSSVAINVNAMSTYYGYIDVNKTSAYTNAGFYIFQASNNQTAYLGFSAEL